MLFNFLYYIGILTCALQGTEKATEKAKYFTVVIAYIASMGGGLLRDIFVLRTSPVAFTVECIPEAIICILAAYYINSIKYLSLYYILLDICDAIGVGCFIVVGIDRAISFGAQQSFALVSGLLTALGGGITSSLICGSSFKKLFANNNQYRVIVAVGNIAYIMGCCREVLIIAVSIAIILSNKRIKSALAKKAYKASISFRCVSPAYRALIIYISTFASRYDSIGTQSYIDVCAYYLSGVLRSHRHACVVFHRIKRLAA